MNMKSRIWRFWANLWCCQLVVMELPIDWRHNQLVNSLFNYETSRKISELIIKFNWWLLVGWYARYSRLMTLMMSRMELLRRSTFKFEHNSWPTRSKVNSNHDDNPINEGFVEILGYLFLADSWRIRRWIQLHFKLLRWNPK